MLWDGLLGEQQRLVTDKLADFRGRLSDVLHGPDHALSTAGIASRGLLMVDLNDLRLVCNELECLEGVHAYKARGAVRFNGGSRRLSAKTSDYDGCLTGYVVEDTATSPQRRFTVNLRRLEIAKKLMNAARLCKAQQKQISTGEGLLLG